MFGNEKPKFEQIQKNGERSEIFDPRKEVREIRNLGAHADLISQEERYSIYKERLADFKQKLANQSLGIAKTRSQMREFFLSNPDVSETELMDGLETSVSKHAMTPWQMEEITEDVSALSAQRRIVDSFFEKVCVGKSGEEIFEYIFGIKPSGRISLKKWSLAPIIICNNSNDFISVHNLVSGGNLAKDKRKVGGFALVSENSNFNLKDFGNKIIVFPNEQSYQEEGFLNHKGRHVYDELISNNEYANPFESAQKSVTDFMTHISSLSDEEFDKLSDEDLIGMLVLLAEKNYSHCRIASETLVKREFLAMYCQGLDINSIKYSFGRSGGGYEIMDESQKQKLVGALSGFMSMLSGNEKNMAETLLPQFYAGYDAEVVAHSKNFDNAFNSVSNLEKIGFSRDTITAIFEKESLANWGKIYSRIMESDESKIGAIRNGMEIINWKIKRSEIAIEDSEKDLVEIENQLLAPSENSSFYMNWKVTRALSKEDDSYQDWLKKREDYTKSVLEKSQKEIEPRKAELFRLETELRNLENKNINF